MRFSENLTFSRFRNHPSNPLRKDIKIFKKDTKEVEQTIKQDSAIYIPRNQSIKLNLKKREEISSRSKDPRVGFHSDAFDFKARHVQKLEERKS